MDMLTALFLGLPVTLVFGAPRPAFTNPTQDDSTDPEA